MTNIEAIDENIIDLQLQEEQLKLTKRKAKWNSCRQSMVGIINALAKIGVEPEFCSDYIAVRFSGDKKRLASVIRIMRTSGYETTDSRPKPGDSEWYAWFYSKDGSCRIWFNFASTICRRVKVGTKMVEQDVYETICGENLQELPCATDPTLVMESTPALTQTDQSS